MLPPHHIVSAVQRRWAEETAATAPTAYPGTRLDTAGLPQWFELWVDAFSAAPQRHVSPDRLTISILVHCFARDAADKLAAHRLANAARASLAASTLTITDAAEPTPAVIGFLTPQQPQLHDLSRTHAALNQERLQHLVLVVPALAHELTTP
jgi:hypothetical protein